MFNEMRVWCHIIFTCEVTEETCTIHNKSPSGTDVPVSKHGVIYHQRGKDILWNTVPAISVCICIVLKYLKMPDLNYENAH